MTSPSSGRLRAVEQVTELFRRDGYDGASLSKLSSATGLGRSSLYHYFPGGKAEMARASLGLISGWIDGLEAEVLALNDPRDRLGRLTDRLDGLYAGGETPCLLGAMSIGLEPELAGDLAQALRRSMQVLSRILTDMGVGPDPARTTAEDAVARVQGALILARALGDTGPFRRALDGIRALAPS